MIATAARVRPPRQSALPPNASEQARRVLDLMRRRRVLQQQLAFEPTRRGRERIRLELHAVLAEQAAIPKAADADPTTKEGVAGW